MLNTANIAQAVRALESGELVAFPTETVYGLGADARNEAAIQRLFVAKGRPAEHPVIVHLASVEQFGDWASDIPALAYQLSEAFSPGPLSLVLRRAPSVMDVVTGGQETVALRIPRHPLARALLEAFGRGIVAPSANRFGRISPTTAEHVKDEFGDEVAVTLDGGACDLGLESTIVDLSGEGLRILRPGSISQEAIEAVLGRPLSQVGGAVPRVSGALKSHYAPETALSLVHPKDLLATVEVARSFARIAVMSLQAEPPENALAWVQMPAESAAYGHHLYSVLRELDSLGFDRILVEAVPDEPSWAAVADRLSRAAA